MGKCILITFNILTISVAGLWPLHGHVTIRVIHVFLSFSAWKLSIHPKMPNYPSWVHSGRPCVTVCSVKRSGSSGRNQMWVRTSPSLRDSFSWCTDSCNPFGKQVDSLSKVSTFPPNCQLFLSSRWPLSEPASDWQGLDRKSWSGRSLFGIFFFFLREHPLKFFCSIMKPQLKHTTGQKSKVTFSLNGFYLIILCIVD